jgi:hypothetical protein
MEPSLKKEEDFLLINNIYLANNFRDIINYLKVQ